MGEVKKIYSFLLVPFAVILLSMLTIDVHAQGDDGILNDELQSRQEFVENDSKTVKNLTTPNLTSSRDSIPNIDYFQKPKQADTDQKNTNEEDDALSLNFLFYIIENYKFSDLMDEW